MFDREFEHKNLKIVNTSNRCIRNDKRNVLNVSSGKHLSYTVEGSWPQETYVHILQAQKTGREEKISDRYSRTSQSNQKFYGC